jgi:hypothetical protein
MDMKRILQAMDGAATKPVAGASDMSKFLSIIDKNNVKVLREEQNNNTKLNEGANPHKVSLPVQMVMQHYNKEAAPVVKKESLLKKYFAEAENTVIQRQTEKSSLVKQYSQKIANRVLENKATDIPENQGEQPLRDPKVIHKELAVLQKQLDVATHTFAQARKLTTSIKYDDTAVGIMSGVRGLITKGSGVDEASFKSYENDVQEAINNLEAAVFALDDPFEEVVKDLTYKIDELESELSDIEYQRKYGRGE